MKLKKVRKKYKLVVVKKEVPAAATKEKTEVSEYCVKKYRSSLVELFKADNLDTPEKTVIYALDTRTSLIYFTMQFIRGNFAWEKYPNHLEGMFRSSKRPDIWYYEIPQEGKIIRSRPNV